MFSGFVSDVPIRSYVHSQHCAQCVHQSQTPYFTSYEVQLASGACGIVLLVFAHIRFMI